MILMGIGWTAPLVAKTQIGCPAATYGQADASLEHAASTWRKLRLHHEAFVRCDDGALAEGYSDAVVSLFASHWDQFGSFVAISNKSPSFGRWAIRHIDASASSDDLHSIVRNADSCRGNLRAKALCGEVGKAAANALND